MLTLGAARFKMQYTVKKERKKKGFTNYTLGDWKRLCQLCSTEKGDAVDRAGRARTHKFSHRTRGWRLLSLPLGTPSLPIITRFPFYLPLSFHAYFC